jgi:serine/threonine-protein kinase
VAALLSLAPKTQAADAGEKSAADVAAAQALFEHARALLSEQRAQEACPLLEESQRLDAGLGTQYNLATCYEAVGRFASAYTLFLEVAAGAKARGQGERAEVARARARAVETKLSRIVISVAEGQHSEVTVERDGRVLGPAQWGLPLPLDPGSYKITASGPGLAAWSREVTVATNGELLRVDVPVLAPAWPSSERCDGSDPRCTTSNDEDRAGSATRPALERANDDGFFAPASRKAGLATAGVALAGLTFGTIFAVRAHAKNARSEEAGCDDRGCPDIESLELRQRARRDGDLATIGFGAGIAGLAATGVLFWILPSGSSSTGTVTLTPMLRPGAALLDVHARF